ncbi:MAG: bifunctional demethylmenaquinone methyltransferase/2-methoxy-6-polyprenyl-1,4-benzoquinol methylase UbiE [Prevotella sp.]|nr:bifunctional demethylmenaquinone methyltransferase/2-methoxy-6-polyprenyl-1,4-benzoquinol methylase UbiE [Prevotella sp.]
MYKQERITPYDNTTEKGKQVEHMFDNIADAYDTLNHRLSWNIDKGWRKKAIRQLAPHHPHLVLDVATGTGDFAIFAARMLQPQQVVGVDISEGMMEVGRQKVMAAELQEIITFRKEDCLHLTFDDNTYDAIIAAFGIRNFQDLEKGLSEMLRVMKEGGHLVILELSQPVCFPMKQLFWLYSHTLLQLYGKLISKDNKAYRYLTASIEAFPQGEEMMNIFNKVGFKEPRFKRLTFGICTMYTATK